MQVHIYGSVEVDRTGSVRADRAVAYRKTSKAFTAQRGTGWQWGTGRRVYSSQVPHMEATIHRRTRQVYSIQVDKPEPEFLNF